MRRFGENLFGIFFFVFAATRNPHFAIIVLACVALGGALGSFLPLKFLLAANACFALGVSVVLCRIDSETWRNHFLRMLLLALMICISFGSLVSALVRIGSAP